MSKMYRSSMLKESVEKVNTKEEIRMNSEEKNQVLENVLFEAQVPSKAARYVGTAIGTGIMGAAGALSGGVTGAGIGALYALLLKSPKQLRELANSTKDPKKKALLNKLADDRESMTTREYFGHYAKKGAKIGAILGGIFHGGIAAGGGIAANRMINKHPELNNLI